MKSSITRKLTAVFFAAMFVMFVTLATAPGAKAATTTKPTGAISIQSGNEATNEATNNVNVTVTLNPSSEITFYCLSNTSIRTCSAWTAFNAEATDVPWTLNGAKDGVKTVYALFKNGNGNTSSLIRDTIRLDRTPPTGSVKINKGAATTSSTEVTLNLTASDRNGSGVAKMTYSIDGGDWITEDFATSKKITLATGNGIRIVQVKFIDKAGNTSGPYSASILLDSAAPTITSLVINDGATYTNSAAVTLTLTVSGDVSKVCYNNDGSACTKWENFSATKKYTLPKGDGEKTVYAWVKDKLGNTSSESASDIIALDTTKPAGSISISNSDTTNTSQVSITLSPSDAGENSSGIASYCLSNTPISTCNTWTPFGPAPETVQAASTDIAWVLDGATDGLKTVYALFKDNAGNISASIKDTIKLDRTPPTGNIKINNGATSTSDATITLTLTANDGSGSGVSQMTFSTDNGANWSQPLVDFAATKQIILPEGDGVKTVQVMFSDKAGNFSGPYGASIVLDTAAPTGILLTINNGELYTNSAVVTLNLAASDAGSGVDKVCYANSDDNSACKWENFNVTKKYTLPLPKVDALKTVYVWVKDKLGYISETTPESSASITLDTTPPELAITTDSFRTRLTSGVITGTKEANSTVSAKLNGTQIDSLLITQALDGTSWSAEVGTFTKGSNKISVTATDLASNETVKTLAVTYDPDSFVSADLTGDWYFVSSGFNTSTNKSWTGYGDVTIKANSSFSGSYLDGEISGKLVIDKNGNITGNATIGESSQIKITNGKMDYNWSMFTILVGNEMLTAVKKGGDFQQTDLAGGWHMYSVYSQQYLYNPLMTSAVGWGTMTCEEDGDLSSGTFNNVSPAVPITVVGSITGESSLSAAGVVSGNLSIKGAVLTTVATFSGQMSPQKNIALIRSTGSGITAGTYNKLIILKDGGDFNLSDLEGRWYLEGIYGDTTSGEVYHGYIDVTAAGVVSGGTINGEALLHNNIQLAIDPVSGEITTTNGDLETDDGEYPITAAKIDKTKNVMTLVSGLKVFVGYLEK